MIKNKKTDVGQRLSPTWVDWLILGVLAIVVVFGWYFFRQRRQEAEADVSIHYLLCVRSLDRAYLGQDGVIDELLTRGDRVTSANGASPLGYVERVWTEPCMEPIVKKGEIIFAENRDFITLYVEVSANAIAQTGQGVRVSDIRIAAGSRGDFRIGSFLAYGAETVLVIKEE